MFDPCGIILELFKNRRNRQILIVGDKDKKEFLKCKGIDKIKFQLDQLFGKLNSLKFPYFKKCFGEVLFTEIVSFSFFSDFIPNMKGMRKNIFNHQKNLPMKKSNMELQNMSLKIHFANGSPYP